MLAAAGAARIRLAGRSAAVIMERETNAVISVHRTCPVPWTCNAWQV